MWLAGSLGMLYLLVVQSTKFIMEPAAAPPLRSILWVSATLSISRQTIILALHMVALLVNFVILWCASREPGVFDAFKNTSSKISDVETWAYSFVLRSGIHKIVQRRGS